LERLGSEQERFFRLGPAPLAPPVERQVAPQKPEALGSALRALAAPPPEVSLSHMALRFPPVSQFLERFRALLSRRSKFDFDAEVGEMTRLEQASAFLAVRELRRAGELAIEQAAPCAPIRVSRLKLEASPAEPATPGQKTAAPPAPLAQENNDREERTAAWTVRSA